MKECNPKLNIMCFFKHRMEEKDGRIIRKEPHLLLQISDSKSNNYHETQFEATLEIATE